MRRLLPLACATVLLSAAAPAQAVVPPRDCGDMKAKGKTYNIKADGLTCRTAREHSKRYLVDRDKPSGYSCKSYSASDTKLKFRCAKGVRSFYAIRR